MVERYCKGTAGVPLYKLVQIGCWRAMHETFRILSPLLFLRRPTPTGSRQSSRARGSVESIRI